MTRKKRACSSGKHGKNVSNICILTPEILICTVTVVSLQAYSSINIHILFHYQYAQYFYCGLFACRHHYLYLLLSQRQYFYSRLFTY